MKKAILFIIYINIPSILFADIDILLELPEFSEYSSVLGPALQDLIDPFIDDIEEQANDVGDKSEFGQGIGTAVGLNSVLPQVQQFPQYSRYSLSIGNALSFYSHISDFGENQDEIEGFDLEESNFELGVSIQAFNLMGTYPLESWHRGLSGFSSLGLTFLEYEDVHLDSFFIQTGLGLTPVGQLGRRPSFQWTPISFQLGGSYSFQQISMKFETDTFEGFSTVDPDGDGPLEAQDLLVAIDPMVDIKLASHIGSINFTAATGIECLRIFYFYFGGGVNMAFGSTSLSIKGSTGLDVTGYFAEYERSPGVFKISGDTGNTPPKVGVEYLFGGMQIRAGKLYFSIPVVYHPNFGFSSGLTMGVSQ